MRKIFALVGGGVVAAIAGMAMTTPASAATDLGGVNVAQYCAQWEGGWSAVLVPPRDAYSWRCYNSGGTGSWVGVNMDLACKQQHNNPGAYARPLDSRNPYSWRCYVG